jgi:hypothetical protein
MLPPRRDRPRCRARSAAEVTLALDLAVEMARSLKDQGITIPNTICCVGTVQEEVASEGLTLRSRPQSLASVSRSEPWA